MIRKRYLLLMVSLVLGLSLVVSAQQVTLTTWGIPSVGSMPRQLGISSSGNVFFAEHGASKIGLLDPHGNTISERSVPHAPSGLVIGGTDSFYYTTPDYTGISLLVFDGGGHDWSVPSSGAWLEYLASAPSGPGVVSLWVNERKASAVLRFSPSSTAVTLPYITSPSFPVMPAKSTITAVVTPVSPQLPSGGIPLLSVILPALGMTSGAFTEWYLTGAGQVRRVAVAPNGHVWASDETSNLFDLDPVHNTVRYGRLPTGTTALGITVAGTGVVWFTDTSRPAIGFLDPATNDVTLWQIPGGSEPFDLISTGSGGIWFTDRGADAIGFLDPTTNDISMYSLPAGSHPTYLVSDGGIGVWFVAEGGNYIGWLRPKITLAPQPVHTGTASGFTGHNIQQNGNELQTTTQYTYDGSSGLPVLVTVDVLSGGVILSDFTSVPFVINQAGKGTASVSLKYTGTKGVTSDQIEIGMYDLLGNKIVSEKINMTITWNP